MPTFLATLSNNFFSIFLPPEKNWRWDGRLPSFNSLTVIWTSEIESSSLSLSISLKLSSSLTASGNNLVIVSGNVTFSVVGLGLLTTDSFTSTFLFTLRSRRNLSVSFKELVG